MLATTTKGKVKKEIIFRRAMMMLMNDEV